MQKRLWHCVDAHFLSFHPVIRKNLRHFSCHVYSMLEENIVQFMANSIWISTQGGITKTIFYHRANKNNTLKKFAQWIFPPYLAKIFHEKCMLFCRRMISSKFKWRYHIQGLIVAIRQRLLRSWDIYHTRLFSYSNKKRSLSSANWEKTNSKNFHVEA